MMFCPECGADISQAMEQTQQSAEAPLKDAQQAPKQGEMTYIPMPDQSADYLAPGSSVAVKTRTPMKLKTKLLLIFVLLVAILAAVFFYVGGKMSAPEKVANDYFESLKQKNWDKTYSYLNITDSDFINPANFTKMQKKAYADMEIANYSVISKKNSFAGKANPDDENSGALTKDITMQYTLKGGAEPQTMEIMLVKQPEKMWLFFDTWKVSPTDYVAKEVKITVPAGTELYWDDVKIPDKYKIDEKKDQSGSGANSYQNEQTPSVVYRLKNIFLGQYTLKVKSPYIEDLTQQITVDSDKNEVTLDQMELKKEVLTSVSKQSQQIIQDVYAAALSGKSFDSVAKYFVTESSSLQSIKEEYQNLKNSVASGTKGGFKSVKFADFDPQILGYQASSDLSIAVRTNFNYSFTAAYTQYGDQPQQEYTGSNSGSISFQFRLEGGKWLIDQVNSLTISDYNMYY